MTTKSVHTQLILSGQLLEPITKLLHAARFVYRCILSPNPSIISMRYHYTHLTTLTIDSTAAHVHLSIVYHTSNIQDPIHWARSVTTNPLCPMTIFWRTYFCFVIVGRCRCGLRYRASKSHNARTIGTYLRRQFLVKDL